MSSISSIGGAGQSASAYFTKLFKKQSSGAASSTNDAASAISTILGQNSGHKARSFYKQIEQNVTSALQSAQKSGSDSDPNQTIEDAIESVLKQTGDSGVSESQQPADPDSTPDATDSSFINALDGAGVSAAQFQKDLHGAFSVMQSAQTKYAANSLQGSGIGALVNTIA